MARTVALVAGLAGCVGTNTVDPAPSRCPLTALEVVQGNGERIETGAELAFVYGPQGGYHTEVGGLVRIEVPEVWLDVRVYDAAEGSLIAKTEGAVGIALADFGDCEGWASTETRLERGSGDVALACEVDGREVDVVVAVSPLDDPDATVEITVTGRVALDPTLIGCESR